MNQGDYFACECTGTDFNMPSAVVTWYKEGTQIVQGKEKAILRFPHIDDDGDGTYTCETKNDEKAKNVTAIELIVNRKYAGL